MALPASTSEFDKHRKKFAAWLVSNGSALMEPTNPFEVARFLTDAGIGVVYRKEGGRITTWTNGADRAFRAFREAKSWRACERGARGNSKRRNMFATLSARDGTGCLYCAVTLTVDTATIEHVLSVTHGGPTHPANLALACQPCNREASHLSAREKVEMAIRQRNSIHG